MAHMTVSDLADELKTSVPAIRLWTRQGMPHRRFGRLVRYELDAVLDWFAEREAKRRAQRKGDNANGNGAGRNDARAAA